MRLVQNAVERVLLCAVLVTVEDTQPVRHLLSQGCLCWPSMRSVVGEGVREWQVRLGMGRQY